MAKTGKKNISISINFGISSAFVLLIILTTLSLCGFIFITLREFLRDDLKKQIFNTVSVGALAVDGDLHNTLVSPDQETGETYIRIKNILKNIRDNAIDIRYVYTMRKNEQGQMIFVVDAEDNTEEMSHIGDIYETPSEAMFEIFADKSKSFVESGFSTDEWGTWLSGFAPIKTAGGEFAGIIGIDMSAKKIISNEMISFSILLSVAGIVSVIVVIFGIIISRRITQPLKTLESDMSKITEFKIDSDVIIKSMFKEIRSMNLAIINMKGSLRSFKKYVPADLVAQLIIMNKEAKLGGEHKVLSIFFSDIEGSTTLGERLAPEELVKTMAGYFSGMTETVLKNSGTIDKYIGDCVMAFWNAPNDIADHAFLACRTAIECQQFQKEFNNNLEQKGIPVINTRIGINTGEVVVGNIGYEERLNYTVLGDHVNLASRLEGINKYYHTNIVISEYTYELVKDRVIARILDNVVVKGKTKDIAIYELLALSGSATEDQRTLAGLSNRAFDIYLKRQWEDAVSAYSQVLALKPGDYPATLMIDRAKKYIIDPPPSDWHGAIIIRDK